MSNYDQKRAIKKVDVYLIIIRNQNVKLQL